MIYPVYPYTRILFLHTISRTFITLSFAATFHSCYQYPLLSSCFGPSHKFFSLLPSPRLNYCDFFQSITMVFDHNIDFFLLAWLSWRWLCIRQGFECTNFNILIKSILPWILFLLMFLMVRLSWLIMIRLAFHRRWISNLLCIHPITVFFWR